MTAVGGAGLLGLFAGVPPMGSYELGGRTHEVSLLRLTLGGLIIFFSLFELVPRLAGLSFDRKYLPLGGALSGFFGGLSGHQGALRSAFLIKAGMSKETFIGTNVVAAVVVDVSRLLVYGVVFYSGRFGVVSEVWRLVAAACLAAFIGTYVARRMLDKVTLGSVQRTVGIMLVALGVALASGLV